MISCPRHISRARIMDSGDGLGITNMSTNDAGHSDATTHNTDLAQSYGCCCKLM